MFARVLATCGAALIVSACVTRKADVTGSLATDLRDRHPIELADAPRHLDVFASASSRGLGERQTGDLRAFAADYRAHGRSVIVAEVPSHGGPAHSAHHGLAEIRRVLASSGVSPSAMHVRTYAADDPSIATPIRLSFAKLQARVPSTCGQWPEDLGASQGSFNASNRPYSNFGCAYQSNLAAQIVDPLDLVRPRQETRMDTIKRMNAIDKLRQGKDPSTEYRQGATKINQNVGSN